VRRYRRGLPDPNQPRNAQFYREAQDYLQKNYGAQAQWRLDQLAAELQKLGVAGIPRAVPTPVPIPTRVVGEYAPPDPPPPPPPVLVAGPIIAWRLWKIRQDGILLSVSANAAWPTGAPMQGEPDSAGEWGGNNRYGIYAMKTRELLTGHAYGRDCLVGQVALWGRVVEHQHGYRAEYAYPVMVDLEVKAPMPGFPRPARRAALAQMIRDNYGCEVRE
jgi:hypothetical protein